MSDQFICISCWQEFIVSATQVRGNDGKVVCPRCGYVQPFNRDPSSSTGPDTQVTRLEDPAQDHSSVAQEIPWTDVGVEDDIPVGEEERTDRVDVPPDELSKHGFQHLAESVQAGEEAEGLLDPDAGDSAAGAGIAGSGLPEEKAGDGVLVPRAETPSEAIPEMEDAGVLAPAGAPGDAGSPSVVNWHLKTPSGLTFKFTDPEALLAWKKKIAAYKQLLVSPDGQRWVDFARFVRQFEELGDPVKAFMLTEAMPDDDLPPPKPDEQSETAPPAGTAPPGPQAAPTAKPKEPAKAGKTDRKAGSTVTTQFTFKVKEDKDSSFGRYLVLAIIGLALGAGIVAGVLYFFGALPF
jgi:DNA-directed RNA polymerase subunit RPC12/RpoP